MEKETIYLFSYNHTVKGLIEDAGYDVYSLVECPSSIPQGSVVVYDRYTSKSTGDDLLKADFPVIILDDYQQDFVIQKFINKPARAYMLVDEFEEELDIAITAVRSGSVFVSNIIENGVAV